MICISFRWWLQDFHQLHTNGLAQSLEILMSNRWNCISMKATSCLLNRFCPRSTSSKLEGMWKERFNTHVVANQSIRAWRFCCLQCWQSKFEIFFKHTRMNHLLWGHFLSKIRFSQKSVVESQFLFQFVRNYS